jgi:hypothetical protein
MVVDADGIGAPRDHDIEHANGDLLEYESRIIDHPYQIIPKFFSAWRFMKLNWMLTDRDEGAARQYLPRAA